VNRGLVGWLVTPGPPFDGELWVSNMGPVQGHDRAKWIWQVRLLRAIRHGSTARVFDSLPRRLWVYAETAIVHGPLSSNATDLRTRAEELKHLGLQRQVDGPGQRYRRSSVGPAPERQSRISDPLSSGSASDGEHLIWQFQSPPR